jgi:outer membrane protein OmpA-like peptidoglycan-associated protein
MLTYFTAKRALFILCLMTMPALTGCYTTAGFGRDVQQVGSWIEGGANDLAAGLYGTEAEDSSAQAAMTEDAGTSPEESVVPAAGNNVVYFSTGSAEIPSDGLEMIRAIAEDARRTMSDEQDQQATEAQGAGGTQTEQVAADQQDTQDQQAMEGEGDQAPPAGEGMPTIQVVGYADSAGPAELNEQLSQRRAEAVADALAAEGLPRESIEVQWHGEEQLPVPTGDEVHEPDNRRVAISMMGT